MVAIRVVVLDPSVHNAGAQLFPSVFIRAAYIFTNSIHASVWPYVAGSCCACAHIEVMLYTARSHQLLHQLACVAET